MTKKIAIITGASSGIGRETAILLAKGNYIVYGGARRVEKLKELEKEGVNVMPLDITDKNSVEDFVNNVLSREGRIDVLINNAGYGEYGAIEDVSIDKAKEQMNVNLFGLARITQLALPYMRKNNYGKIVNISSIGGKMATPMGGWYYASKFALEAFSDSLRLEVKQFGIDVIVIEPGGIKTEWPAIANNNGLTNSGNTAYSHFADVTANLAKMEDKLPHASVIAVLIKKAIEAKRPKTRYVKGYMAKPILFVRKILCDKLFDKVVLSQFRYKK